MLADLAVGDGKFFPELEVLRVDDGFVVESAEHQLAVIVAVMDAHPHPFAWEALSVALELDFHEVAALVPGHVTPLSPYCSRWAGRIKYLLRWVVGYFEYSKFCSTFVTKAEQLLAVRASM